MKTCRLVLTIAAALLSACAVFGGPPGVPLRMARADDRPAKKACVPLKIDGDTVIVVKSLPCTVTAPPGADFYFWNLPTGVVGTAEDNVLTVTAAPKGESTISVVAATITITVDKDGKVTKVTKKDNGSVVLTNGSKPPVPPPPADPLTAAFQTAYDADQDADRAASLSFLAAVYKSMASQVGAGTKNDLKTNADFVNWIKTVVGAPGGVGLTADKLKSLRSAVAKELSGKWGTTTAPLSAADAASELAKVAVALSGVQ